MIVWGTEDTWIPVDRAERLAQLIPGAELTLIERAGHLIQLDSPAAVTSRLRWRRPGRLSTCSRLRSTKASTVVARCR